MIKTATLVLATLLFSGNVLADWTLINNESDIYFVSTKKNAVSEVHYFKQLGGEISDKGKINIDVNLASVETHIPVRNERVKSMLFEVSKFPKATVTATIDADLIKAMPAGSSYIDSLTFTANLHGVKQTLKTDVRVIKLLDDKVLAVSVIPVIISASQFRLEQGIEQLRKIAKLPSISTAVPVTFSLMFQPR